MGIEFKYVDWKNKEFVIFEDCNCCVKCEVKCEIVDFCEIGMCKKVK